MYYINNSTSIFTLYGCKGDEVMSKVIKEYERYHLMWDALIGVL
jgi:hypothetical protein